MSRQAQDYLSEHLPEIRRATYTDTTKKTGTRHIGENGLALLVYLCDHTNREGVFFMSARSMQEGAGIATIREVRRLLAGFTELGWITPTGETVSYHGRGTPTPVYALTLLPGVVVNAKSDLSSVPGDTPKTIEKTTEPLTHKGENEKTDRKTEPEPEPQPGAGWAWDKKHDQLLADILACEDMAGDKGNLKTWLVKQYKPLVVRALRDKPAPDLVAWCLDMRRGIEHKHEYGKQPCTVCNDYVFHGTGDPLDGKHAVWLGNALGWQECQACKPAQLRVVS
jgi:hypothetical protein